MAYRAVPWASLFNPGTYNINNLTTLEYIGKNSAHPNVQPWDSNNKNFAPTIGLSYSLPWLGRDKTVIRAGYGIAYERNTLVLVDQIYGYSVPGYLNEVSYAPPSYQNLVNSTLPLTPTSTPFATVPINDNNASTQTLLVANTGLKTPVHPELEFFRRPADHPEYHPGCSLCGEQGKQVIPRLQHQREQYF